MLREICRAAHSVGTPTVRDLYELLEESVRGNTADLTHVGFTRLVGDELEALLGTLPCKPQSVVKMFGERWGTNPAITPTPPTEEPAATVVPPALVGSTAGTARVPWYNRGIIGWLAGH
jgi:hypothetical protein